MKREDKKLLYGLNVRLVKIYEKLEKLEENSEEFKNLNKQYDHVLREIISHMNRMDVEEVFSCWYN